MASTAGMLLLLKRVLEQDIVVGSRDRGQKAKRNNKKTKDVIVQSTV